MTNTKRPDKYSLPLLFVPMALFVMIPLGCLPQTTSASDSTETDRCILELMQTAADTMTIGEVKGRCNHTTQSPAPEKGAVEERLLSEKKNSLRRFSIMSHQANYLLLAAHNFQEWNSELYGNSSGRTISFDDTEVQFQLSVKTPLAIDLFDRNLDIFGAYTVQSFWQAYNSDISSPFRETNHQPEIWLQTRHDWSLFGIRNSVNTFGFTHQSNGQSSTLSRSWNRVYAGFLLEKGNLAVLLKPWIRLEESATSDDNPDITDFLGHGEMHLAYKKGDHVFSLMSRNNLESGFSKGAVELGWSFPLFRYDYIKGYIQYFSGYGESLIDYNSYVNKIGIGVMLTDIL
ncbi:phospholipase A [Desulforhopalus sp. IMCC35007]|uniref:phospholipase A n=1 Tax=Desulforhopalus sp. IMCC35007 TaxID=2569543 RepID=UPI0010AE6D54|nr:phospholipase A [Desulforhopalus sp. IMCC35007]TKB10712.1 phospholipase [Desulforhopalus sp. IMCC35007]